MGPGCGLVAPLAFPVLLDLALDFGGGADAGLPRSPVPILFLRLRASSLASDGMKSIPIPFVYGDGCDESRCPKKPSLSSGGGAVAFIGCAGGDLAFIVEVLTFTFADAAWNVGYADAAAAAFAGGCDGGSADAFDDAFAGGG